VAIYREAEARCMMQVWRRKGDGVRFVRVLHEGTPVSALQWTPFSEFVDLVEAQVPTNIVQACTAG
jgi:2-phosphoxylose phosphatase